MEQRGSRLEGNTVMLDELRKKKLTDIGTRYEHLRELADAWHDGIIAIESRQYQNDEDKKKRVQLQSGIDLIERILATLGEYHDNSLGLGSMIDRVHREVKKDELDPYETYT